MNGMNSYHNGDAAFHRKGSDKDREIAQCKELLANQTKYIKTLQDENLRLNKEVQTEQCLSFRKQVAEQEALIAELVAVCERVVSQTKERGTTADITPRTFELALMALEKVGK